MWKHSSRKAQFTMGVAALLGMAPLLCGQASKPGTSAPAKPRGATATQKVAPGARDIGTRIDAYVRPFADGNNFSGVIYVARGGHVLFEKGYGMANYEFAVPNNPQTRFHIASVSKSFGAAAILLLEEQGKLSTADPVAKFLPDYPNGEKILLEHLLTHSAGIPNLNNFPEYGNASRFSQTATTLVAMFRDKPLDFEPGTRFRYSNSNYVVLALIIEKVSGQSYGEFLKANIFDPLGLGATAHDSDATQVIAKLSTGTEPESLRGVKRVPYLDWSSKTGNGSLLTTTGNLCRFAGALFGGKLLKPASLAKVMQPGESFPYGWTDRERSGHKVKGVGGRSPGFISNVEYSLDDGTCVAILSNSYSSVAQVIAPDISAIVYGKAAEPGAVGYVQPRAGQLAEFTGRFQMPDNYYAPRAILTVQDRGGYLEATWSTGGTTIIYPAGGDNFVDRTYWAMVRFTRDNKAQITGFTYKLLQDFSARKL
jgi:CubicO group peptidase (beta-lactamase class C family)